MRTKSRLLGAALIGIAVCVGSATSYASDPVGVYGFIEKVVFEPDEKAPERIQIWGGFALAEGRGGNAYTPAQRGYMYYAINPGEEEVCRKEWNDLKSLAGTEQFVAYGVRFKPRGTVRPADAKPEKPDLYPIGLGVTKIRKHEYSPIKELAELRKKAPAKAGKTSP